MSANESENKGTEYTILEQTPIEGGPDGYLVYGSITSRTPEKAIEAAVRQVIAAGRTPAPVYVAVPTRSWSMKPVQVDQEVTVKIG